MSQAAWLGGVMTLKLTYNQQVSGGAVLASFIRADAGDVSCVCQVYRRDGQYALYVQPIFSLGANLLLYHYLLKRINKISANYQIWLIKKSNTSHTDRFGGVLPGDVVVKVGVVRAAANLEFLPNNPHIFISFQEDVWRKTELWGERKELGEISIKPHPFHCSSETSSIYRG